MLFSRSSGVLLHITSLPSPYGIGDLGPAAYTFADHLAEAGQSIWQVLPIVPVGYGESPYASPSTFAGNPLLISPDLLVEQGALDAAWTHERQRSTDGPIAFAETIVAKREILEVLYARYVAGETPFLGADVSAYIASNQSWLPDYALYMALKEAHGLKPWYEWPLEHRNTTAEDRLALGEAYVEDVQKHIFWQFVFEQQWSALKAYCHDRKIKIFGDLPIYVSDDSADVWANRDLFHLDESGYPTLVSGVPPDYFSATGQRWGNPIYRWDCMKANGYTWWTERMARICALVDFVRLDHFRGFEAFWQVPASEETAIHGSWVEGPGVDLFDHLQSQLGSLPLVAENLGVITQGVTDLMDRYQFPGMAILQFAFDSNADNEFLPHNYAENLVAYTGTHDNDTVVGWWSNTASTQDEATIARAKDYCRAYLEVAYDHDVHWRFIRALSASKARLAIYPMQDILGCDATARMNTPGSTHGNWMWRMSEGAFHADIRKGLRHLTELFGRLPQ